MGPSRFPPCSSGGAPLPAWIELEGAANVRDVGGIPGMRPGVLLRSDNLQGLTDADVAALEARGVRLVVDLRTAEEVRLEGPGPLVGRVEIRHRDLYPEAGERTDVVINTRDGEDPAIPYYLAYLEHRPDSIVGALEDIATADGAVVVHCAAGKDRTGVVVALALAAAGVSREAILEDYLATAERIGPIMKRLRASETYRAELEPYTDESRTPRRATMEGVLRALDAEYGGPVGWLRGQGFDPEPLRRRLLR
jgi:protein-tyrosine phosphatase